jgi:acyl carrier protein
MPTAEMTADFASVRAVVVETLGIEDRAEAIDASTPLSTVPELDSLAVLELVVELEERFGIVVEDDDITTEVFETVASLTSFVAGKLGSAGGVSQVRSVGG